MKRKDYIKKKLNLSVLWVAIAQTQWTELLINTQLCLPWYSFSSCLQLHSSFCPPSSSSSAVTLNSCFLTVWSWLLSSLFPFLLWFTWFIPRELKTWRKAFRNWIVLPFPTGGAHLVFCALLTTLYRKWSFWCLSRTVPYISKGLYLAFFDSVLLWGRFCSADPPLI